ncbi:MAG TPA: hypothetical protein EYP53_00330, partial [Candidatus Latescibacteria bacterium]|nr:hypothetical protein [Candidatus Latescibacterota bacterium]
VSGSAYSTRTRDEIISDAQAYKNLNWTCYNTYPDAGDPIFEYGHSYTGEAYWYGGWDTREQFLDKVENQHLEPRTQAGIDCSGLVSRCWGLSSKYGTWTLQDITTEISKSQLLKGDILNYLGHHVRIYYSSTGISPSDKVFVYEALGDSNKVVYEPYTWSNLANYTPRRWNELIATTTWGGIKALYAAAPRNAAVELQWDPAPGANGATRYKVCYGTSSGSHPNSTGEINGCSKTVSGLTPGTRYYFVVKVGSDADGWSEDSNELWAVPYRTVNVPGDYSTIQAAIDAAPSNYMTRIEIAPGTYNESLTIGSNKPVWLHGAGHGATVVQGGLEFSHAGMYLPVYGETGFTHYYGLPLVTKMSVGSSSGVEFYYSNDRTRVTLLDVDAFIGFFSVRSQPYIGWSKSSWNYVGLYLSDYSYPGIYIGKNAFENNEYGIYVDNSSRLGSGFYYNSIADNSWNLYATDDADFCRATQNWWGEYPPDMSKIHAPNGVQLDPALQSRPSGLLAKPIAENNDLPFVVNGQEIAQRRSAGVAEIARLKSIIAREPEKKGAVAALEKVMVLYWDLDLADEAASYLADLIEACGDQDLGRRAMELQVSNDIWRGRPGDALIKARTLTERFSGTEMGKRLLFRTALIYWYDLKDRARSRKVFEQFIADYPSDILSDFARMKIGLKLVRWSKPNQTAASRNMQLSNSPNPFNSTTSINLDLSEAVQVRLSIYNTLGQRIRMLLDGKMQAGSHSVIWNGRDESGHEVASGVYLCALETTGSQRPILVQKMVLLR